ncbi:hypothetical protein H0H92_013743 [Tricholoma furcatifolium]|nr:hypothetical protein H0H92_013743 [Tricholoma furcatifolium]
MFHKSNNNQADGQFSMIEGDVDTQINAQINVETVVDAQAGRGRSKACLDNTRIALLERITAWALNPTGERTLLLHGALGMGKSAITRTIASKLEDEHKAINALHLGSFQHGQII